MRAFNYHDVLRMLRISDEKRKSAFEAYPGDWSTAQAEVGGYSSEEILDRVLAASLAVHEGRAVHERDSVNFDRIDYSWPVLSALLWSAAQHGGDLRVLDVGGSLGTSFRQNRRFLSDLPEVSWAIVEQPAFVAAGREHFQDGVLTFHETIEEAAESRPHIALLGSSLQYLKDPLAALESLSRTGASALVLDRTPVHLGQTDLLTIQHVPPSIYQGSYPAWIFARDQLLRRLEGLGWAPVEEFPGPEPASKTSGGHDFSWTGFILRRDGRTPVTRLATT